MLQEKRVSKHFTLHELASGVYAAIATGDGLALSNGGFVNLGKETLLFDAFLNVDAARDLWQIAAEVTGNRVTYVVNSHFHLDHVVGNQVFPPDVAIISSEKTWELLSEHYPEAVKYYQTHGEATLREREAQLQTETDPVTRYSLQNDLLFLRSLVGYTLESRLPDITFSGNLTVYGSERQAILWSFPVGHTPGDTALYLPDDGIIFMGDLLCVENHPWLGHGDQDQLLEIFAQLSALNLKHVIPGHGPVATPAAMDLESQYIAEVKQIAERLHVANQSPDDATLLDLSPIFADWDSKVCFSWNIGAIYEKLGK